MSTLPFEAFPMAAEGLRARSHPDDVQSLEHLEDVTYHLRVATEASKGMLDLAGGYDDLFARRANHRVSEAESGSILRHANEAIREAVSAFDTGLMAVNRVLSLGIAPEKVTADRIAQALRAGVAGGRPALAGIETAIEDLTRSIAFDALRSYRHWATHRGAPRIGLAPGTSFGVDLRATLDEMLVTCFPFVPPVFRRTFDSPVQVPALKQPARVVMPDGTIGFKLFEVSFHAGRLTLGDLESRAPEYEERNSETLEVGRVRVAGEELAQYTAREFVRAVFQLVWSLHKNLAWDSDWDVRLAEAAGLPNSNATATADGSTSG